jgi:two-component system phosphate regulon response regulator OmpR
MLTARSEVPHRIRGLEVGADDYLAKPFEPRELLLRITSILRRGTQQAAPIVESISFGPFTFHVERGELKQGDNVVRITDRERDLLRIFAARPGETVKRHEFLKVSNGGGERAVDVQINRLRRKIEEDPSNPVHLQTARGIGYRLLVD